jgi:hypothetical protein
MQEVEQRREQLPSNTSMNAWHNLPVTEAASLLAADVEQYERDLSS